jgi:hypothetical protein
MTRRGVCLWIAMLLWPAAALAEATVVVGRSQGGSPAFKLDNVPPPARNDAAARAKFTLADGSRDQNGGDVAVLNDGLVPAGEDQPRANFFFAAGADGGRVAIDLGAAVDVKQVNTYSWHGGTRGPQVYVLYGSDGSSGNFDAAPKRDKDPEKAGWNRVASVDTRPKDGEPRGQYAVSVADPAGNLGKFRYLLLDVSPAEKDDGFGNTFYTEVDVVDAAATEQPVAATPAGNRGGGGRNLFNRDGPMDPNGPAPVIAKTEGGQEIVFDYSAAPELKDWVETKLKPVCVDWYPKIVAMLPSDNYEAPKRFTIFFSGEYRGVAAAGGSRIVCSTDWFKKNLDGEAAGAVVHEMVHVVQQYRRPREGFTRNPGWLVEGLADWIRWFNYEPESKRPKPRASRANYNDSYRTTGHFLDYVVKKYDKDLIRKLNAAMREGRYTDDIWKEVAGKTAEELGREWKDTLPQG